MNAPRARLILVGAGHAHVEVLRTFAMQQPDAELTLISPHSHAVYSGMVPGFIAGQYRLSDIRIDAAALAARANARFIRSRVTAVDVSNRRLQLEGYPDLSYEYASFDIGSTPAAQDRIRNAKRAIPVKPIEIAVDGIGSILNESEASATHTQTRHVVVVGAGPGGVEVAFAVATRLASTNASTTLCDRAQHPVAARGDRTSAVVEKALAEATVKYVGAYDVTSVDENGVHSSDGRTLPADLVVWATGAAAPQIFADSGLSVDDRGFLLVDQTLRSVDDPKIFGAGDCASLCDHPDLAKAGVYAVRQGPILAKNLAAVLGGTKTTPFRPQSHFLSLLNTGDGRAILSYRSHAIHNRLAWRLKDRIDRRFIERYRLPSLVPDPSMGEMAPCGGCAAKVGSDVLRSVLQDLDVRPSDHVLIGLRDADDSAVFSNPEEEDCVSVVTSDLFPPFPTTCSWSLILLQSAPPVTSSRWAPKVPQRWRWSASVRRLRIGRKNLYARFYRARHMLYG